MVNGHGHGHGPPVTWLDRTIGWLAPAAQEKRMRARARMQLLAAGSSLTRNYYDGVDRPVNGSTGFYRSGQSADPNAVIGAAHKRLRDAARDLVRNNPNVSLSVEEWETSAAPMSVRALVDEKDRTKARVLNEVIDTAWWQWSQTADFNSITDFDGLQCVLVRELIEAGGCLVRKHVADRALQIQLLELDHLDDTKDHDVVAGGGFIMGGVQFDAQQRRVGYWVYKSHPGATGPYAVRDRGANGMASEFIPAADMLMVFDPQRAGQQLGVTRLASALQRARDMGIYEEAELIRKQTEACLVASVEDPNADTDPNVTGVQPTTDSAGNKIEALSYGLIMYPAPGRKTTFHQPTTNGGYVDYMRAGDRRIAAGAGTTYERATGDYSQVNFSSARMGDNAFHRRIRKLQNKVLVPQFLRPIFEKWWLPVAVLRNEVPNIRTWSRWTPPAWDSISPIDDARANEIMQRSGEETFGQLCARKGLDPADQVREIAEYNEMFDAAGVILQSDPRHRTAVGNSVKTPAEEADAAEQAAQEAADNNSDPSQAGDSASSAQSGVSADGNPGPEPSAD
jgi:lambda family phage portal protein